MRFFKLLTLALSLSTFTTASILARRHSSFPVKRGEGIVVGAELGTSYLWKYVKEIAQCPTLTAADLQTSLEEFDSIFPNEYDEYANTTTTFGVGALYLSYPEGTYAFYLQYTEVTPNTTATWVDTGADIANVWKAVREDIYHRWSHNATSQFVYYDVDKIVDGVSNYAGEFEVQVQTPSFIRTCDTSCGGDCDPNICTC